MDMKSTLLALPLHCGMIFDSQIDDSNGTLPVVVTKRGQIAIAAGKADHAGGQ